MDLEYMKEEYHVMARDLGYAREVHGRIDRAKSENEIYRIMHDFRNRAINEERKNKQIARNLYKYAS